MIPTVILIFKKYYQNKKNHVTLFIKKYEIQMLKIEFDKKKIALNSTR